MRATRFCAYAQPPHTPQNAINANTSVVAHSVRTVALRSTREATNRRDMPIRLPLKQTSPSLSIARSPHRVPGNQRTWIATLGILMLGVLTSTFTFGVLTTGVVIVGALMPVVPTPVTLMPVVLTPVVLMPVVLMPPVETFEPPPC